MSDLSIDNIIGERRALMRLGIIGAGNIGQAVARMALGGGHDVMVSNSRGPDTLQAFVRDTGALAGAPKQAADFGDMVLVAVPLSQVGGIPAARLAGKIVVDANNYYPERDGAIPDLDAHRTTTSEYVAARLPGVRLVKAFNAILAIDLNARDAVLPSGVRRALPFAGNDIQAKAAVGRLIDQFGFDAFDAGALADSWRFERAKPAYCIPLDRRDLEQALATADRTTGLPEGSWRRTT
ncbi:MAG: NAD(P)-binding domain-containing protein [Caulobacteraceae bacterium]|nr:NAD(P)-binding domain-containing protein [Caulobacteraceae bacterium]